MTLLQKLKRLAKDPPPQFAFEVSCEGLAWAETERPEEAVVVPWPDGALQINPVNPNFTDGGWLAQALSQSLPPAPKPHQRLAVLVLPDYCGRVAVLDFDSFPVLAEEQIALARFRIKRTVPFEIEDALVACYPQPRRSGSKKIDVVAVAISREIATQYLSPFRSAGFQCGLITISGLAALALDDACPDAPPQWIQVKRAGRVLSVCLVDRGTLRMFRCVELDHATVEEMIEVLAPTIAYAEDEFGARPARLRLCGFPAQDRDGDRLGAELDLPVERIRSPFGAPGAATAGLFGLLSTMEVN
jgi:type IV pilus assembly protein PilM